MDFRQLYYFLSVCEHNCIAQAAQSLFISPQALSKAISQLEKEFQMSLFSRTPQGLILTEAGEHRDDKDQIISVTSAPQSG